MAKKRVIKVNMEGVEAGGILVPEADYLITPVEISQEKGGESGKDFLAWVFEITEGKYKGKTLYYNTSLQPQALWNLRGLLESLGVEVPDEVMELDLDEIEGNADLVCGCTVEHEKYEGKNKARIADVFPADSVSGGDEGEKTPAEDIPSEDDIKSMDESDLQEVIDAFDLDVDLSKIKLTSKKRAAVNEALEEKRNEGGGGEASGLPTREDIENMSVEELQALIDEHSLEINLKKIVGLSKKQAAVADALEEAGSGSSGDKISEDDINGMGTDELVEFVKEHKLKVTLSGSLRKRRRAVLKAAQEEELVE